MIAVLCWLYIRGTIPPCFWVFFAIVTYVFKICMSNILSLSGMLSACGRYKFKPSFKSLLTESASLYHKRTVGYVSALGWILTLTNTWQNRLRFGAAGLMLAINISVYCVWIPAKLQISSHFIAVNTWWDRCEVC